MHRDTRVELVQDALARYRIGRVTRRHALGLLAALGVSLGAATRLLDNAKATTAPGGRHGGHGAIRLQEGTPGAEAPPPAATPVLGEQPDGTFVWRVQAGGGSEEDLIDAQAFFPEEITVNTGDTVFFEIRGFHTVTFPSGGEVPKLFLQEDGPGTPAMGGTPATGGGRTVLNPAAAFPAGNANYDGTAYANSGLPIDPTAPPYTLTFTTPGTYEYICLVHPAVMKARIVVQEQGAERPHDQAAYDQMASEQEAALIERGRALIEQAGNASSPAAGTGGTVHEVSAGVGEDQVQVLQFLPRELEIKVGDSVRWTNPTATEPHTVTFLGGEPAPEFVIPEPGAGGPPTLVFNPAMAFPAGEPTYAGTGYVNSGVLGRDLPEFPAEFPRSATFAVTFDAAGEYNYYCAFHAGGPDDEGSMTGAITVTG